MIDTRFAWAMQRFQSSKSSARIIIIINLHKMGDNIDDILGFLYITVTKRKKKLEEGIISLMAHFQNNIKRSKSPLGRQKAKDEKCKTKANHDSSRQLSRMLSEMKSKEIIWNGKGAVNSILQSAWPLTWLFFTPSFIQKCKFSCHKNFLFPENFPLWQILSGKF